MQPGQTASAVLDTIRNRRNAREFTDEPVSRELLETILEAATWAPNHRNTEPWRFLVLEAGGEGRAEVADAVAQWTLENALNPNLVRRERSAEAARREILDAPAFMYVFSIPGRDDEVTTENYAAAACAVQNLSLAAHALGLAVGWSTGRACMPEVVKRLAGASDDWRTVGALYVGYPVARPTATRAPVSEVVTWI